MNQFIQSLESRRLLSADPAVVALEAEAKAVIADVAAAKKVEVADVKLITADLKAGDELKTSRLQLKALSTDFKDNLQIISKSVKTTFATVRKDVNKGIAVVRRLTKKPDDPVLTAKLNADVSALQSDATSGLASINAALAAEQGVDTTDIMALEIANVSNTQLATDLNTTAPASLGAARMTISVDATTALVTDVNAIVTEANNI